MEIATASPLKSKCKLEKNLSKRSHTFSFTPENTVVLMELFPEIIYFILLQVGVRLSRWPLKAVSWSWQWILMGFFTTELVNTSFKSKFNRDYNKKKNVYISVVLFPFCLRNHQGPNVA